MYFPYLRGKQFELVMLREMAPRIAQWGFTPIIEPVRENFPALRRAIDALKEHGCAFIIITNPTVGTLKDDASGSLTALLEELVTDYEECGIGICLTANSTIAMAEAFMAAWPKRELAFVHYGFTEGKTLAETITAAKRKAFAHIFVENKEGLLYRKHFKDSYRVIIEDAFIQRANKEYQPKEKFSELYLTYEELNCDAFGDFLIVGSEYREGGGPAYAIAIHLTYVDPDGDNAIHVKHYVSDQQDSPKDPAGKFFEALAKLVDDVNEQDSLIYRSNAVAEYVKLYENKHYPGLGYVKKLSMQHHVELMAHVLNRD